MAEFFDIDDLSEFFTFFVFIDESIRNHWEKLYNIILYFFYVDPVFRTESHPVKHLFFVHQIVHEIEFVFSSKIKWNLQWIYVEFRTNHEDSYFTWSVLFDWF